MSRLFMEEEDCVVDVKPIGLNMGFIEEDEDHCVPTCPCPETSVAVVVSFFPSPCDTSAPTTLSFVCNDWLSVSLENVRPDL